MDDPLAWRERRSRRLKRCGIFDLYRSRRTAADGRSASFYVLKAPAWVNVVPVLADPRGGERLLMVRQFRQGIQRATVEFPAGLAEPGEDPREAASRELAEETGYRAASLRPIGRVAANPAFMDNWCLTFCAEGLEPGAQSLDALERLEVLEVPLEELQAGLGEGELVNSLTVVALHWYLRYRGGL
jgi:8-oxo-dGTP pyrophosphatase MutT (NUDIX family)